MSQRACFFTKNRTCSPIVNLEKIFVPKISNRIVDYRTVPAGALIENPRNWRTHPTAQREAMARVLDRVGFADALLVRETPEGLQLIDGHLRAEVAPDAEVPVLVLDVTEDEADLILATHDPIAEMAGTDGAKLQDLLDDLSSRANAEQLLAGMAEAYPVGIGNGRVVEDPQAEWTEMPEYENEDNSSHQKLLVHFADQAGVDAFAKLIGQKITPKTVSVWYPEREKESFADKEYAGVENDAA